MKDHCCFAGCDLVTCHRCGESRCVRALHFCTSSCPECGHPMSQHATREPEHTCAACVFADMDGAVENGPEVTP